MAAASRFALIRSTILNVAAVGGVLCIAWVVAALVFHLSLIMFRTGSMSPGIPAGSLALVREIPVSEAHVGDVVTVDRPGLLPVTHRVVEVTAPASAPAGTPVEIVLKGDANPTVDPAPYRVSTVRIVLWSQPGLARAVVWLGHPAVIGSLTVATTALVTWMFWPRRAVSRHRTA
ncbi:signal peptidase, endoplasmic reticulum-type [Leifsonia sp. 98AMF]|uniref:signal peptidase I n=1 Tax=unclassified Leifsonia TaxID=2663824 RepID=UPI00087BFE63|nr:MULTISPECIES: signal peptidase I [unclassified Leifsonia]SDH70927.1 signal peptidase, endoplasmic reticulum-type [Leifsonia sp. 197AMF]SDI68931.1 signal peptidase, endoplasmic reticulum-type [Leifsonia sp. 466MF]SDK22693.1 signal peptidase, endoplasmic reticulum-type [Leifsonia sp. 157MF]SDN71223.1 signal peptidase, endoplasmic reticulum-type [Leifsonia sp. 509MF]SEN37086.1 signal peptidase, endoplasmic reticulum-type [Leifsonia sp. 467MF]